MLGLNYRYTQMFKVGSSMNVTKSSNKLSEDGSIFSGESRNDNTNISKENFSGNVSADIVNNLK